MPRPCGKSFLLYSSALPQTAQAGQRRLGVVRPRRNVGRSAGQCHVGRQRRLEPGRAARRRDRRKRMFTRASHSQRASRRPAAGWSARRGSRRSRRRTGCRWPTASSGCGPSARPSTSARATPTKPDPPAHRQPADTFHYPGYPSECPAVQDHSRTPSTAMRSSDGDRQRRQAARSSGVSDIAGAIRYEWPISIAVDRRAEQRRGGDVGQRSRQRRRGCGGSAASRRRTRAAARRPGGQHDQRAAARRPLQRPATASRPGDRTSAGAEQRPAAASRRPSRSEDRGDGRPGPGRSGSGCGRSAG